MTLCIPRITIKKFFIITFFLSECIRMSGKNINFNDKKIKKSNFYKNKKINKIDGINVNNILISKKESYRTKNSLKYFTGHNDNDIMYLMCKTFTNDWLC